MSIPLKSHIVTAEELVDYLADLQSKRYTPYEDRNTLEQVMVVPHALRMTNELYYVSHYRIIWT